MNSTLRYFLPALGLAAALPVFAADEGAKPDDSKKETKQRKEIRVITAPGGERGPGAPRMIHRMGEPGEMETVTFLGVETGPVSATLAAQLGLTEGSGLVVNHLTPDGPAKDVLKQHDILV